MKQIDRVYNYVITQITKDLLIESLVNGIEVGVYAYNIEKDLDIVRNNASTLLNSLHKDKKLIKINSKPIRFFPKYLLDEILQNNVIELVYEFNQLQSLIIEALGSDTKVDPFKELIGYDMSLKYAIEQAKAATMYPPNGLHTLITGQSGTGKTLFAQVMYKYALLKKNLKEEDFPFVSFNCSDYYNNPQLLLSHLFGHVKGSFTGADYDRIGLVEKANGGILFLDEIHRLPPEGQEMLFFIMDRGEYSRLGEVSIVRKCNLSIIAATTEDPHDSLLKTFLRRIPVMIYLPSLKDKMVEEKVDLVFELLTKEAMRINKKITVPQEVLKGLSIYDCKGNIGQLKSDIKMIFAKSYLKHLQNKEELKLEFEMLPETVKDALYKFNGYDKSIKDYFVIFNEDIIIDPSNKKEKISSTSSTNIYDEISKKLDKLKEEGLSTEEIEEVISTDIDKYFKSYIKKIDPNNFNIRELYKLLDPNLVDFTFELVSYASNELNIYFQSKIMFILSFHIKYLLERIKDNKLITSPEINNIKETYSKEYEIASKIVDKIGEKYDINVPIYERGYITILLANNVIERDETDRIGILIISHGDSTASSMANVCNKLLNTNYVKAIDMPLEESIDRTYAKAITSVKALNKGKGVIILVDMGSLINFGDRITKETGIITKTLDKVSTPLVLEVLRQIIYKDENIEDLYSNILNLEKRAEKDKPKAIMTLCSTGVGTSLMIAQKVDSIVKDLGVTLKTLPFNYKEVNVKSKKFKEASNEYKIIACVGNIQPETDIPYFSFEELFIDWKKQRFSKYIVANCFEDKDFNKDIYEKAREILEEYSVFINPKKTVIYIKGFINELLKLNKYKNFLNNDSHLIKLIVHIGIMIERVLNNTRVIFDELELYKANYLDDILLLKRLFSNIEEIYSVEITEDEICFILRIINSGN